MYIDMILASREVSIGKNCARVPDGGHRALFHDENLQVREQTNLNSTPTG